MKIAPRRSIAVIIFGLFLAASLLLVYSSSDSAQAAGNYNPTYSMKLCNGLSSVFVDGDLQGDVNCINAIPATGAARTITINNTLATGDLNFSAVTYFEPNAVGITPGCNVDNFSSTSLDTDAILDGRDTSPGDGVGNGIACLRPGDKVGGLRNLVSLGILNGPCTEHGLTVDFVLYNVALPNNINDPRASTNIYTPGVEGTGSSTRFSTAGGQVPGAGFVDNLPDNPPAGPGPEDGDNLADVVITDPLNAAVSSQALTNYPDWLLDIFDPDWLPTATPIEGPADPANSNGSGNSTGAGDTRQNSADGIKKPLIPLVVYGGITSVAGSKTPLYFVQFDDGVLGSDNADGFQPPSPFSRAQATLGQPYTTILTDTTPIILGTSPISDFCTGLITTIMIKGTTESDKVTRATNPASAGSHPGLVWTASQRDLDNDDLEAQIDTCPTDVNTDTFPRVGTDPDGDMIDAACDLDVGNAGCNFGADPVGVDLEGGDDCDGDGWQNALDNCPLVDNVLQTQSELLAAYSSSAPDGGPKSDGIGDACESGSWSGTQNGVSTSVTLSSTVSNGHYHVKAYVMPICYGAGETDNDGDGWCLSTSGESDTSALEHPNLALITGNSNLGSDHDGDGTNAWVETFMGIEDAKACNASLGGFDEPLDARGTDLNDDSKTNVLDVNIMKPTFFTDQVTGGAYTVRNDQNGDTKINVLDVNIMKPHFFTQCTLDVQQ